NVTKFINYSKTTIMTISQSVLNREIVAHTVCLRTLVFHYLLLNKLLVLTIFLKIIQFLFAPDPSTYNSCVRRLVDLGTGKVSQCYKSVALIAGMTMNLICIISLVLSCLLLSIQMTYFVHHPGQLFYGGH